MRYILSRFDLIPWFGVYIYCLFHRRPGPLYAVAMMVAGISFILWWTARAQLGDSFSARPKAHKLITTGLYSRIRNPIYLFGTLAALSICFGMHWYWVGGAILVASLIGQWRRARAEARVLEAAFGEEYRQYRAQTWF
jgi:protein-S-isoprenylcysteine O-methyltransferase Ste14